MRKLFLILFCSLLCVFPFVSAQEETPGVVPVQTEEQGNDSTKAEQGKGGQPPFRQIAGWILLLVLLVWMFTRGGGKSDAEEEVAGNTKDADDVDGKTEDSGDGDERN